MREPLIEARQVEKYYGQSGRNRIQVIAPLDLCVYPGEILALLGPSGSGKSTLLRMLTGLAGTSGGQVLWHNKPLNGPCENVSIVFQSFALFPWLTVLENVEAPLKARGVEAIERHKRSLKILDTVGLDGFESAYPKELSGGMKQRVGFARALVVEPEVLFMDEPFSALDVLTAENLRGELLELWEDKKIHTRAVFIVTHNIEEAILLADRIIVLGKNPGAHPDGFQGRPAAAAGPPLAVLHDSGGLRLQDPDQARYGFRRGAGADARDRAAAGTGESQLPDAAARAPRRHRGLSGDPLDHGGHDDIYHLADDLQFEIDDMLPTVEAGVLLGFLKLTEGDAEITDEGRAFVEADILKRKDVFRDAALERVSLLRQITRSLDTKADRTLPAEFFQDMLEEHFSEDEAQAQIETAVNWGRYAELFDYDRKRERFFIPEELPAGAAESGVGHGL